MNFDAAFFTAILAAQVCIATAQVERLRKKNALPEGYTNKLPHDELKEAAINVEWGRMVSDGSPQGHRAIVPKLLGRSTNKAHVNRKGNMKLSAQLVPTDDTHPHHGVGGTPKTKRKENHAALAQFIAFDNVLPFWDDVANAVEGDFLRTDIEEEALIDLGSNFDYPMSMSPTPSNHGYRATQIPSTYPFSNPGSVSPTSTYPVLPPSSSTSPMTANPSASTAHLVPSVTAIPSTSVVHLDSSSPTTMDPSKSSSTSSTTASPSTDTANLLPSDTTTPEPTTSSLNSPMTMTTIPSTSITSISPSTILTHSPSSGKTTSEPTASPSASPMTADPSSSSTGSYTTSPAIVSPSTRPTQHLTNSPTTPKYYMNWGKGKCVKDCNSGLDCGGKASYGSPLYDTLEGEKFYVQYK